MFHCKPPFPSGNVARFPWPFFHCNKYADKKTVVRHNFAWKTKRASYDALNSGGRWWIRFSAEKPRRLRHASSMPPSAGFRIHLWKKRKEHLTMLLLWWEVVDSNHRSRWQQIYSLQNIQHFMPVFLHIGQIYKNITTKLRLIKNHVQFMSKYCIMSKRPQIE